MYQREHQPDRQYLKMGNPNYPNHHQAFNLVIVLNVRFNENRAAT